MLFGGGFLGEIPRQRELGLEHSSDRLNPAIKSCGHPTVNAVKNMALDIGNGLAGVLLVPLPVQWLRHGAELDKEVARQVFRLDLPALFLPKPNQRRLVVAHDDPGIRAANKTNSFSASTSNHHCTYLSKNDNYDLNRHFGQIKLFSTESLFCESHDHSKP